MRKEIVVKLLIVDGEQGPSLTFGLWGLTTIDAISKATQNAELFVVFLLRRKTGLDPSLVNEWQVSPGTLWRQNGQGPRLNPLCLLSAV